MDRITEFDISAYIEGDDDIRAGIDEAGREFRNATREYGSPRVFDLVGAAAATNMGTGARGAAAATNKSASAGAAATTAMSARAGANAAATKMGMSVGSGASAGVRAGAADDLNTLAAAPEPAGDIDASLTTGDMLALAHAEVARGIARSHIESLNAFYQRGVREIVCNVFKIDKRIKNTRTETAEDRDITDYAYSVRFTDAKLPLPITTKYRSGSLEMQTPNLSRIKNLTYSSPLLLSIEASVTAVHKNGVTETKTATVQDFRVGSVPVGTGTSQCHTAYADRETLKEMQEDPMSTGGVFIIKGGEWVIDSLENLTNNTYHVYKGQYQNEVARGTFLSKPGDDFENSYYMVLRYLNNGAITIEIVMGKNEKFDLPFYLLFRALGMTSDRDIVNNIVYGIDNTDPITTRMLEILDRAFGVADARFAPVKDSLNSAEIIRFIATLISDSAQNPAARRDENIIKYLNGNVLASFDNKLLPHIGNRPEHRGRKLRFLGHLINKLLRVDQQVLESTDRDSYRNKRVHAAGVSLAKSFKTYFNFTVVQEIGKRLAKTLRSTTFGGINLADTVTGAIGSDDLERMLTQAITTGNKTITLKRNEIQNRVSSQQLYHKNDMNVKSTLNTINTPNTSASKQNERADEMRRVHSTYLGYIDISQSNDSGEKVGMTKQKACMASISSATSSATLKEILLADPEIIPIDTLAPEQITAQRLAKVFVNGDWIGCCREAHLLTSKYRTLRRYEAIHPDTTIVNELLVREVYFWTDVGRLLRPLIVVYNNLAEYNAYWQSRPQEEVEAYVRGLRAGGAGDGVENTEASAGTNSGENSEHPVKKSEKSREKSEKSVRTQSASAVEFRQWIKLTRAHIDGLLSGRLTMEDLRRERVIDYISPEEQENCLIAYNIDHLRRHERDVTHMFTHCDIDQAVMGVVTLASPMTNHSSAGRVTMFTNHRKQSAGWFALNWPFRIDKNVTLQYYAERPLVSTFGDVLTYPNGHNAIVALALYTGQGQEDSIIVNKSSVDCGMFNASHFNNEKTKLEKNEQFGNPDFARTKGIKRDARYEDAEGGFVRKGTVVTKGSVLIVKSAKIPKPADPQILYEDRSVEYKSDEPAYAEDVVTPRNDEDALIAKVKLRSVRPLGIGDKLCLTPDHDVLTHRGWIPVADVALEDRVAILDGECLRYEMPTELHAFDHDGDMYCVDSMYINTMVTMDHRMYVAAARGGRFALEAARDIVGQPRYYKKNARWDAPDVPVFTARYVPNNGNKGDEIVYPDVNIPMDIWLDFLGIWISDGNLVKANHCQIQITCTKQRKVDHLRAVCAQMGFGVSSHGKNHYIYSSQLYAALLPLNLGAPHKHLPDYVWNVSARQANILLASLISGDGSVHRTNGGVCYSTSSTRLADDIMRLASHCGISGYKCIDRPAGSQRAIRGGQVFASSYDSFKISLNKTHNTPPVNRAARQDAVVHYIGRVYCLTVRTGIFMVRRAGRPYFTGNSSREGNKGIVASMLNRVDMPYTVTGLVPDLIVNAHSIPTRMAINQLMEGVLARLAVERGSLVDATAFRKIDIDGAIAELETYGVRYGGHTKMLNGFTGEYMDTHIFIAPTCYQRLQKFVIDENYSIRRGPTSQLTHQPLDGRAKDGGLRIGEMERDVFMVHGAMRALHQKFYANSDGTTIYVCRVCHNRAIVNEREGIYKCKFCEDAADIAEVQSSWVANLLMNECGAMGIRMQPELQPYEYLVSGQSVAGAQAVAGPAGNA
jgi:DNA-directed RNA polymerase beta subunit